MWEKLNKLLGLKQDDTYEKVISRIESHLLDYKSTQYETIFTVLKRLSNNNPNLRSFLTSLEKELTTPIYGTARVLQYRLYESIVDKLPELGEALDTYVDNILAPDDYSKSSLIIISNVKKQQVEAIVKTIMDTFEFESKVRLWVEKTLLYGDYFVEIVEIEDDLLKEEWTVVDARGEVERHTKDTSIVVDEVRHLITENFISTPNDTYLTLVGWDPHYVVPLTARNVELAYLIVQPITDTSTTSPNTYNSQGFNTLQRAQHCRKEIETRVHTYVTTILQQLRGRVKFDIEEVRSDLLKLLLYNHLYEDVDRVRFRVVEPSKMVHFSIPSATSEPFGKSLFAKVAHIARYLILAEFALLVYRLTRAPDRRVFKVEIGRSKDAANILQSVIRKVKQKETFLKDPTALDALITELGITEDFFVPVVDGKEFFSVDTLAAGEITGKIEDIEYLRKKLISGLGIPAIYLIQEESSESKYTLAQENIKFARTIVNYQKTFSNKLTELIRKIVARVTDDPTIIAAVQTTRIVFRPPVAIQMERLSEMMGNVSTLINTLSEVLPEVDKTVLARRFLSYFFDPQELDEMLRTSKLRKRATSSSEGTDELGFEQEYEGKGGE